MKPQRLPGKLWLCGGGVLALALCLFAISPIGRGQSPPAASDLLQIARTPVTLTNGQMLLALSYFSDSNHNYVVEYRDDLGFDLCNNWQALPNAPHNYGIVFTESQATNRFYRLRRIDEPRAGLYALLARDTGTNSLDGITSDPTITGLALQFPAGTLLQACLDNTNGNWTTLTNLQTPRYFLIQSNQLAAMNGGTLPDGPHTLYLRAGPPAGHSPFDIRNSTFALPFTLDTTPPSLSLALHAASDSTPPGDSRTTVNPIQLVGQTEPGLTVHLLPSGLATVADTNGAYAFTNVTLAVGTNQFFAYALDAACNETLLEARVCWYGPDCTFPDTLEGWNVTASQPSTLISQPISGSVVADTNKSCVVVLTEGDSFLVTLSKTFQLPAAASTLSFTYSMLSFDGTATNKIKDAFEAALVDASGTPMTYVIVPGSADGPSAGVGVSPTPSFDSFFNASDSQPPATAQDVSVSHPSTLQQSTVRLALHSSALGSSAKLVFRLLNNDQDHRTTVRISDVKFEAQQLTAAGIGARLSPAAAKVAQTSQSAVSQISNLRAVGKPGTPSNSRTPSRLEAGDTAGWKPAPPGRAAGFGLRRLDGAFTSPNPVPNPKLRPAAALQNAAAPSPSPGAAGEASAGETIHLGRGEGGPTPLVAAAVASPPIQTTNGDSVLPPDGRITFTTTEGFLRGELFNLNATNVADELRLNAQLTTFPFIWIANSGEGTISKFDTRSGRELGRYRTGPEALTNRLSPSRTTVDSEGNVWVGNRAFSMPPLLSITSSVVKVLLTGFIDRNSNGVPDTCIDSNGDGHITESEVLTWDANGDGQPDDERIALVLPVGRDRNNLTNALPVQIAAGARSMSVDESNNVWVGHFDLKQYEVYDGLNGALKGVVATTGGPYGAVIDRNGMLWGGTAGYGFNLLEPINTRTRTYLGGRMIGPTYGLTIDPDGVLWISAYDWNQLMRYDPQTTDRRLYNLPAGFSTPRGVCVDRNRHIWTACTVNDHLVKYEFASDHITLTNTVLVRVGSQPTAAVLDSEGFVWTTTRNDDRAWKIDPTNNVVVTNLITGRDPYNYSDMTGNLRLTAIPTGRWTEIVDSQESNTVWGTVRTTATIPAGTAVSTRVRVSNSRTTLDSLNYLDVLPGQTLRNVTGRFLQVEVTLAANTNVIVSPGVQDITIAAVRPPSLAVTEPPDGSEIALGSSALIAGTALADTGLGLFANTLRLVTINGVPVDALDASGNFFTRVTVAPGQNVFTFTATDAFGQTATTNLTLIGVERAAGEVDFSQLVDASASVRGEYGRTSFNEATRTLYAELSVRNIGQYALQAPLLVGIRNLSDPTVRVVGADGTTPDGMPYYEFTIYDLRFTNGAGEGGPTLNPQQSTLNRTLAFSVPNRQQFTYDLVILGQLNRAPVITTVPILESIAGHPYVYNVEATDPDGDALTFSLIQGPVAADVSPRTLNPDDGGDQRRLTSAATLRWTPSTNDLGTHAITLRVSDGRGGSAEQHYLLSVIAPPPNRPPVITSVPVVSVTLSSNQIIGGSIFITGHDSDAHAFVGLNNQQGAININRAAIGYVMSSQFNPFVAQGVRKFLFVESKGDVPPIHNSTRGVNGIIASGYQLGTDFDHHDYTTLDTALDQLGTVYSAIIVASDAGGILRQVELDILNVRAPDIIRFLNRGGGIFAMSENNLTGLTPNGGRFGYLPFVVSIEPTHLLEVGNTLTPFGASLGLTTADINGNFYHNVFVGTYGLQIVDLDDQGRIISLAGRGEVTGSLVQSGAYRYDADALDADADPLTYSLTVSPAGMTIDQLTGIIRWSPTVTQIGPHNVTVQVSDGRGGTATQTYVVTVLPDPANHPPIIISQPVTNAIVNDLVLVCDDFNRNDSPTVGNGFEQFGPTFISSSALMSFGQGGVGGGIYLQNVHNPTGTYTISYDLMTTDGSLREPFLVLGSPNVSFTADPRLGGQSFFGVGGPSRTSNGGSSLPFYVSILGANFQFTSPFAPGANEVIRVTATLFPDLSSRFSFDLYADGIDIRTVSRPAVTPSSGFVPGSNFIMGHSTGIPSVLTKFDNLLVTRESSPDLYRYDGQALDPDGDSLTYRLVIAPSGMSIDPLTGRIMWRTTSKDIGDHAVTVRVEDGRGGFDTQSFVINVGAPPSTNVDLVVGNVDRSGLAVDGQSLAAAGTVSATVTNLGPAPITQPFDVLFFEDINRNGAYEAGTDALLGQATVSGPLAAGQSTTVSAPVAAMVSFPATFVWALADSGNAVTERNEGNNVARNEVHCQYIPPVGQFNPVIKVHALSGTTIIATPIVANLTDDNNDGLINAQDIPDIIFPTLPTGQFSGGPITAISGDDGHVLFTTGTPNLIATLNDIAVGDIDGDGLPDIIAAHSNGRNLIAFEHNGRQKWLSDTHTLPGRSDSGGAIAIANLDTNGLPEIIVGASVYDAAGHLLADGRDLGGTIGFNNFTAISLVADLDLDGVPEVIAGPTAYKFATNKLSIAWRRSDLPDGFTAIANFDDDSYPEIVLVGSGNVYMLNHDGTDAAVWHGPVQLPGGGSGGAPTIGDFDGDGIPDIGIAGRSKYSVFKRDGSLLWSSNTQDASSEATGSSAFDFDGDGKMEIVYRDEVFLRVYRGEDGAVLLQLPIPSGTATELPVIADVDNDGNAEIVVCANGGAQGGIYIIGDANDTWVSTRRIWNQQSYHITNVEEDGTIPRVEKNSWQTHNTYRLNQQTAPGGPLAAPDLAPSFVRVQPSGGNTVITARIGNGGELLVGPGIKVSFFNGDPSAGGVLLGVAATTNRIVPGTFEDVSLVLTNPPSADLRVFADRDQNGLMQVNECDETNNLYQPPGGPITYGEIRGLVFEDTDGNGTNALLTVALRFDSLPSAQGWDYFVMGNSVPETNVFRVDGTTLYQNSLGVGFADQGGNRYSYTNGLRPDLPFVMKVRARVTAVEGRNAPCGFCFGLHAGTEAFGLRIGTGQVIDFGFAVVTNLDGTQFHDYVIEGVSNVGYRILIDGQLVRVAPPFRYAVEVPELFLGDGTGGENARAEVREFLFTQRDPDLSLTNLVVFLDTNGNRLRDAGEPFTVTDWQGKYAFTGLRPGNYRVLQELPPGWIPVAPPGGVHLVTLAGGQVADGINFINRRPTTNETGEIHGTVFDEKPVGCPPVPGQSIRLRFDSLPSAQCWPYLVSIPGPAEAGVYSVDGTKLFQDTIGTGFTYGAYYRTNAFDPNLPFTISFRARVLRSEDVPGVARGPATAFTVSAVAGAEYFGIGLNTNTINAPLASGTFLPVDATQFHDYRIEAVPGVSVSIFVDGTNLITSAPPLNTPLMNVLGLGNASGYEKGAAEVTRYVFSQPIPGLAGFVVFLDQNGNGRRDPTERFTLTDTNGNYSFRNLLPSSYTVAEEVPVGWMLTTPPGGTFLVNLANAQVVTGVDFGNQRFTPPTTNRAPAFVSNAPTNAAVGQDFLYDAAVFDADGDALTFDLTVKPVGMVVQPSCGIVAWVPTADLVGSHAVVLRVQDGRGGVAVQSFQVTVRAANSGPVITSRPTGPALGGLPWQYPVRAQDADGDAITFRLEAGPTNMIIGPPSPRPSPPGEGGTADALVQWTPLAGQTGLVHVAISASDSQGATTTQFFDLPVVVPTTNHPPQITSQPRTSIGLGQTYLYLVTALDEDSDPLTFSLSTNAPTGMTLTNASPSPGGEGRGEGVLIIWTPTAAQFGSNYVEIRVSDGRITAIQSFPIFVVTRTSNAPPQIVSTPPFAAIVGTNYAYDARALDPDGDPLSWSLDTFPSGMSLDPASGTVRWTPTLDQLGTNRVVLRVFDAQGGSGSQTFVVVVRPVNLPPQFLSSPPALAETNELYQYPVRVLDAEGGPLDFTLVTAPTNLAFVFQNDDNSLGTNRTFSTDGDFALLWWVPVAGQLGTNRVVIQVRDDDGGLALQEFNIVVTTNQNHAPVITSSPASFASTNALYQYQITATDADGDTLGFILVSGPAGMVVNTNSGLLQWTPGQTGNYSASVAALDPKGAVSVQNFTVTVLPQNQPPTITSAPVQTVNAGALYRYDVRASDPDGNPLTYSITGPAGMTIDQQGRATWQTSVANAGIRRVNVTVSDPFVQVTQSFDLAVVSDTTAPFVRIGRDQTNFLVGTLLDVPLVASDSGGPVTLEVFFNNVAQPLGANQLVTILLNQVGTFTLRARATDAAGNVATDSVDLNVLPRVVDPNAPVVALYFPTNNPTLTAITNVLGTAKDANLLYYTLAVALRNTDGFTEIWRGSNSVDAGVLGRLDPSTLANDSYTLRLTAVDAGGNTSTIETDFEVAGELKVGNFRLSFVDLSIPVNGIPVTVARTYDSLDANRLGDFGYGWRLEFRDARLRTSVGKRSAELQELVDEFGDVIGIREFSYPAFRDGTRIYVTPPGGRREGFTFKLQPGSLAERYIGLYRFAVVPDQGVTSQLSIPGATGQLLKYDDAGELFWFQGLRNFNPEDPGLGGSYLLSTKDGIAYTLDAASGLVTSMVDPNGNTLAFSNNGITNVASGVGITFARDPRGRITAATDPMGHAVRYQYDNATDDLTGVTDRATNTTQFAYSARRPHFLERVIDPLGRTGVRTGYDDQGRLRTLTDAAGNVVQLLHNPDQSTEQVVDALGRTNTFVYDERGNVVAEVNALGGVTRRAYDANNYMTMEADALGNTNRFSYDGDGNVLEHTDPLGNVSRNTYQEFRPAGLFARVRDPRPTRRLATTVDPLGNATLNTYDGSANLVATTDAAGRVTRYAYDGAGNQTTITDVAGNATQFDYDGAGHLLKQTDALGNVAGFAYDGNGNQLSQTTVVTVAPGVLRTNVSRTDYDANGRPLAVTDALGNTTRTIYDALGNTTATLDALGHTNRFVYDDRGQLLSTVFADGTSNHVAYDAAGRRTNSTDRAGRSTSFEYDVLGRLVRTAYPGSAGILPAPTTSTIYDLAGRVLAQFDERTNRTAFAYDPAGRQTAVTNALGFATRSEFDSAGRKIADIDALGRTTRFVYDELGRRIHTLLADGTTNTTVYDALGRVAVEVDQAGVSNAFGYDALGRLTSVTNALGTTNQTITAYAYNEAGNLLRQQDAKQRVTRYEYDGLGRRIASVLPLGQRSGTLYNPVGNVAAATNFNGQVIAYEYDANNRLARKTLNAQLPGAQLVSYAYTSTGRRAAITNGTNVTVWTYDARDRLIRRVDPDGRAIAYAYDAAGNRTLLVTGRSADGSSASLLGGAGGPPAPVGDSPNGTPNALNDPQAPASPNASPVAPGGSPGAAGGSPAPPIAAADGPSALLITNSITRFTFDALNRLETVIDSENGTNRYSYDAAGNVLFVALANGTFRTNAYDALNRVTSIAHLGPTGVFSSFRYTLGPTGQRMGVQENTGRTVQYAYDPLYRLTRESITDAVAGNRTVDYALDSVGNRLARLDSVEGRTDYSYDDNDQLLTETFRSAGLQPAAVTTYGYDLNGNTTSRSNANEFVTYTSDAQNRLVGARIVSLLTSAATNLVYQYDDDGIRVAAFVDGDETRYLIDANRSFAQVVEEWTSINSQPSTLNASYTHGPHHLISQSRAGARSWYHADGLGSTRALTGQSGSPTDRYQFDAYGRALAQSGPTDNAYLYAGEQRDRNLGLDYLRARYLNFNAGRFYGRDAFEGVLRNPTSRYPFVFVNANPVNTTDPSGAFTIAETVTTLAVQEAILTVYTTRLGLAVRDTLLVARFKLKPGADLQSKGLRLLALGDPRGYDFYVQGRRLTSLGFSELSSNLNNRIVEIGQGLADLKDLYIQDEQEPCFGPVEFLQKRAEFFASIGDWLSAFAFIRELNGNLDQRSRLDDLAAKSRKFGLVLEALSDTDLIRFLDNCQSP